MLHFLAAGATMLRHWKIVAAAFALLVAVWSHGARLRTERALERCRGEAALAGLRLERAAEAAKALRRDSDRRAADQARRLDSARRANEGEAGRIERLRRSAAKPRPAGACTVSETLREAKGL